MLGKYGGYMATEKEWMEIFNDTNEEMTHTAYKFGFDLEQDTDDEKKKIVIDPVEANFDDDDNPMLLMFINDIRKNIMISKATKEDEKRKNCEFFIAKINGWPHVFVITTKNISKNKELLMDYGEAYTHIFEEKARYQRIMNYKKNICDNITNQTIAELPINGPYQLE